MAAITLAATNTASRFSVSQISVLFDTFSRSRIVGVALFLLILLDEHFAVVEQPGNSCCRQIFHCSSDFLFPLSLPPLFSILGVRLLPSSHLQIYITTHIRLVLSLVFHGGQFVVDFTPRKYVTFVTNMS